MNRLDMNRVADAMAARMPSTVHASVSDFVQVSPTLARVVVSFNTLECSRDTRYNAVTAALKNSATPVEGSFREVASFGNPAMVGYVALNREVKPYEEVSAKKMVALASNMLMDTSDDSLWDVRSDAAGNKMLCRQTTSDMKDLLVTARVRQKSPKLDQIRSAVDSGDFVSFVDPKTETLRYGYVVATNVELTPAPTTGIRVDEDGVDIVELPGADPELESEELRGDEPEQAVVSHIVPVSLVIEAARLGESDKRAEVAAPVNSQSTEAMKAYYKELYAYDPAYYAEIVKIIDQHAGI